MPCTVSGLRLLSEEEVIQRASSALSYFRPLALQNLLQLRIYGKHGYLVPPCKYSFFPFYSM